MVIRGLTVGGPPITTVRAWQKRRNPVGRVEGFSPIMEVLVQYSAEVVT